MRQKQKTKLGFWVVACIRIPKAAYAGQALAYVGRGPHTMHKACMGSSARNPNPETAKQKNRAQIKTLILTTKHAQDIKKTIKLN